MINIDHLSEEELIHLNRLVVERLKVLEQMRALQSMVKLHMGQRVCFDPDGRMRTGAIVKFNHKTVVVRTDDQHQWKVAPHYLKPLGWWKVKPPKSITWQQYLIFNILSAE